MSLLAARVIATWASDLRIYRLCHVYDFLAYFREDNFMICTSRSTWCRIWVGRFTDYSVSYLLPYSIFLWLVPTSCLWMANVLTFESDSMSNEAVFNHPLTASHTPYHDEAGWWVWFQYEPNTCYISDQIFDKSRKGGGMLAGMAQLLGTMYHW